MRGHNDQGRVKVDENRGQRAGRVGGKRESAAETGARPPGDVAAARAHREALRIKRREFRRPRIFLAFTVCIFLFLYVGVLTLQWAFLMRQAVEDARANAQTVTELLATELASTAPMSRTLEQLGDPDRYEALDRIIRHKLGRFGLIKSKIYDLTGKVVYADNRALVGKTFQPVPAFREALSGAVASQVMLPERYHDRYGTTVATPMVETYVPLEEGGRVQYVFETYEDFAPVQARLWRMVRWSGILLAAVVGAALGGLALAYRWIHRLQVQVRGLERLLPICSTCKKIRVEDAGEPQRWVGVEDYFGERDRLEFTHGMCPECLAGFKSRLADRKVGKQASAGGGGA